MVCVTCSGRGWIYEANPAEALVNTHLMATEPCPRCRPDEQPKRPECGHTDETPEGPHTCTCGRRVWP